MRNIIIAVVTAIATIVGLSGAAAAKECKPGSVQELQQLLVRHSPFDGEWSLGQYRGLLVLSFKESAGIPYVAERSSKWSDKILGIVREYTVKLAVPTKIGLDLGSKGHVDLSLSADCRIDGVQHHPKNGRVAYALQPTDTPNPVDTVEQQVFASTTEFAEYLVRRSPFKGHWRWANRRAKFSVSFRGSGEKLQADTSVTDSKGATHRETVDVHLLGPNLLAYSLSRKPVRAQLEPQKDGSLMGIQEFEGQFALRVSAKPGS